MSKNNRNSHPIFPIGAIAGVIGTCIAVLTYLDIKPEKPNPSAVIPSPRVYWEKTTLGKTLTGRSGGVYSVAIGPDDKTLASASADNTIKIWSLETFREIATLTGHSNGVNSVAFSRDGKTLASGSYQTIKIWQAEASK